MNLTASAAESPRMLANTSAWIDYAKRIVSFTPHKDFQKLSFPSHQEMFSHVIELGFAGYSIL